MKRKISLSLAAAAALTALACVTINVYFPEAEVKELAVQIEDAIERQAAEGDVEMEESDTPPEETSQQRVWLHDALAFVFGTTQAYAFEGGSGVAAPEISNPAIRRIIANRAKRAQDIRKFKTKGVFGENRNALLEIRSLDGLQLKDRAAVQKMLKAENTDREAMFKEIAAATGTDLSHLAQIRTTYAETLRAKAKTGDAIQLPNGSWQRKK